MSHDKEYMRELVYLSVCLEKVGQGDSSSCVYHAGCFAFVCERRCHERAEELNEAAIVIYAVCYIRIYLDMH